MGPMSTEVGGRSLLSLLQLASAALPVGAYSYSEGLERLVEQGIVTDAAQLQGWLCQELQVGVIRLETALMVRAYGAAQATDWERLQAWNQWLSATRETEELRQQSWQMGRSLLRLLQVLAPDLGGAIAPLQETCNFAVAFALAAAHWQIPLEAALLGYLHGWSSNLINAGVKLIPLGQTAGQRLLLELQPILEATVQSALTLEDDALGNCGWGLALASMQHETQYTRLFRS